MKDLLSTYFNISEEEYDFFLSKCKLHHYKKNEHLLKADTFVNKIFFIRQGLVRGYRIIDGHDVTHHFFQENWFATDYEGFLTGKVGELYLQALFDTTVYTLDKSTLASIYKEHDKFEKIRFILAEYAYLQMLERFKDLQTKDLKERYHDVLRRCPDLFKSVSQKYIASYLGVAPQSLSRVKKHVYD